MKKNINYMIICLVLMIYAVFPLTAQNKLTNYQLLGGLSINSNIYSSDFTFLPTAEFDKKVRKGGYYKLDKPVICNGLNIDSVFKSAEWWRVQWWRRQGIRELVIPFKYQSLKKNQYCLLHMQELGIETDDFKNLFWKQNNLAQNIDTIITQDGILIVHLLPGEGKMLKFSILPFSQEFEKNKIIAKLFPNPADNIVFVSTTAVINKIEIYSMQGELIKTFQTKEINIDSLSKGIYFIRIGNQYFKFVKI